MSDWMREYAEHKNRCFERGGDIEVECDKCHERFWTWDDLAGVGAGYPHGWQFIVHIGCGGVAMPIETKDD